MSTATAEYPTAQHAMTYTGSTSGCTCEEGVCQVGSYSCYYYDAL